MDSDNTTPEIYFRRLVNVLKTTREKINSFSHSLNERGIETRKLISIEITPYSSVTKKDLSLWDWEELKDGFYVGEGKPLSGDDTSVSITTMKF